jgi:hypothetical protein
MWGFPAVVNTLGEVAWNVAVYILTTLLLLTTFIITLNDSVSE